jgi:hypothetical protein
MMNFCAEANFCARLLIVQDSDLFNMAEKSPYWQVYKGTLPSETIEVINEYRRKFGKPII